MNEIELRDLLRIAYHRRWYAITVFAVCLAAGVALAATATPQYRAELTLFVGERQLPADELGRARDVSVLSHQLMATYAQIVRSRSIAGLAVERGDLPVSAETVAGRVEAEPVRDTQIIRITYMASDPELAQRVTNAVGDAFVDEIEQIDVPSPDAEAPAVRVSIVDRAVLPESPASRPALRFLIIAVGLGAVAGAGLAFLVDYLDTSVKDRRDLAPLGLPMLASIPHARRTRGAGPHLDADPGSRGAESFTKLRTAIQFAEADPAISCLLVTSPEGSEGGTTVAVNLACSYARAGLSTVLVEADLRRPSVAALLTTEREPRGLTRVLSTRTAVRGGIVESHVPNLSVLPAGARAPDPGRLLGSPKMHRLLGQLAASYDVVIVDAPPVLPVADATLLAPHVDGVIVVARHAHTRREVVADACAEITAQGGRVLGVVLNRAPAAART